jgi:hypothetical protein
MSVDDPATHRQTGGDAANPDLSGARHDAYAARPHHNRSGIEPVANPSSSNRYFTPAEWAKEVEAHRQQGDQLVSKGETLKSIATSWLRMSNQPTDTNTVNHEIDRIVQLNSDQYPQLARTHTVHPNMILKVWTDNLGPPDRSTRYSAWREAAPGTVAFAMRGDQIYADHAQVVATDGSRVALGPGSTGFIAKGARVYDADASARIINAGGTVEHNRGADYIEIPQVPGQQVAIVTNRQPIIQADLNDTPPQAPTPPKHKNWLERIFSPHHHDQPQESESAGAGSNG